MTTIRLGFTRYGPSAPSTFQLGKYDVFTRIGVPVRSTSKSMVSVPVDALVTTACGSGAAGGVSPGATRAHDDGPSAARYTFHCCGSLYQTIAGPLAFCSGPFGSSLASFGWGLLLPYTHCNPDVSAV